MEITLADVKAFAASRGPEEEVGYPSRCSACLVAETIQWKYPGVYEVDVAGDNRLATVYMRDDDFDSTDIDLPVEVKHAADKFDRLGQAWTAITRQDLEVRMPELFEKE
jgi:hypothetical protein